MQETRSSDHAEIGVKTDREQSRSRCAPVRLALRRMSLCLAAIAPLSTLPRCQDPFHRPAFDCGSLGLKREPDDVDEVLCPALARIWNANCEALSSARSLAALIGPMRVLDAVATPRRGSVNYTSRVFTGLYMPGLVHEPYELAQLLVHLAKERMPHQTGGLRFVSTNSNNGWAACICAAYLHRTHGGGFHGLAVNDLKTEWATTRHVRILLLELGLSWRHPLSFDAEADAALMSYHPHVRNSLTPTAFAHATTLMPVGWVGTPPPFDVCFRMGAFDAAAVRNDTRALGGYCSLFAYYQGDADGAAASHSHGHAWRPATVSRVGPYALLSGLRPAADSAAAFAFVNKTPPAPLSYYEPHCIRDMAGCDWHREVRLRTPAEGGVECRQC